MTKVVDNATPNVGDTVTYTVTVTNNGPTAIPSIVLTDALPSGLTEGAVMASIGTWSSPNWTVGSLAPGVTETITIEALVDAGQGGNTLVNTVTKTHVGIDDLDSTTDDPSESITITSSDLVTIKTVSAPSGLTYDEGETVTYTITVTNSGDDATGVSLVDNLPVGVTYVSDNGMGAYNDGSGVWTIGNLDDGDTAILTIEATIGAGTAGQTITNTTTAVSYTHLTLPTN